jgi:AraC-like DNA-binding protein
MPDRPNVTAHTHLASLIAFLAKTLEARGFDRLAMLRQAGIDPAQLDAPDARLPCTQVDRLWHLAMEASANDLTIALDTALRYDVGALHVLGFGLQACSNLARATERLARASAIFNTGLRATSSSAADRFEFSFDYVYPNAAPAKDFITAATLLQVWRGLLGVGLVPLAVEFAHVDPPQDAAARERINSYFGCPVLYRQKRNVLSLALAVAQQPLPLANPRLAARGDAVVDGYLADLERSAIATAVVRLIAGGAFDKSSVARGLNMSTRTLQRRLIAENLSFMQLLTDTRRELARTHRAAGQLTIKEVAYLLGYSDPANFSRAFRGWFGVAPDVFRQGEGARPDTGTSLS